MASAGALTRISAWQVRGNASVDCRQAAAAGAPGHPPVDRRKGGLKRSVASDGHGIPLGIASAGANRHDSPLLAPTLRAARHQLDHLLPEDRSCHLDAGYDSTVTRQLLDELGFDGQIARKGIPAPIQAGTRWVIERTHSWMNGYGKLRRYTERNAKIVDFYLYLAATLVVIRQLIQRARTRYRARASRGCRRSGAGCAGGDLHVQVASGQSLGLGQAVRIPVDPGGGANLQDVFTGGGLGDGQLGRGAGAASSDLPAQPPCGTVLDQLGGPEGDLRVVVDVQESG